MFLECRVAESIFSQSFRDCALGTIEGNVPLLPQVWTHSAQEDFRESISCYTNADEAYTTHVQDMPYVIPKNVNVYNKIGFVAFHAGLWNKEEAVEQEKNYKAYTEVTHFFVPPLIDPPDIKSKFYLFKFLH